MCVDSDLNYLEETSGGPNLTLATLPKSNKIVLVQVCVYNILLHVIYVKPLLCLPADGLSIACRSPGEGYEHSDCWNYQGPLNTGQNREGTPTEKHGH